MFPPVATEDAFSAISRDEGTLRRGLERLAARLGVDPAGLTGSADSVSRLR